MDIFVFFFKQKTAYEMRISDWSSDVCSSDLIGDADIVISDAGTGRVTLGREQVAAALRRRRHRPVLLIDAGVPADIEPGTGALEDAFVYDLDDLERLAKRTSGGRAAASAQASGILEDELAAFLRSQAERPATPAVVEIGRAHV